MVLIQKLQVLSLRYHSSTPTGKLLSKLVSDVQFVKQLIYENMTDMLHLCIDIVFICVVALMRMPLMLVFYIVVIPLATGLIRRFLRPIRLSKVQLRKKTERSNAAFKEMLEMEALTRSHGLEQEEYRNIRARVREVRLQAIHYDRLQNRLNNVGYGSFQGSRLLCLCFAGYLATQGLVSIGSVVLFLSLFDTIVNSVQKILDTMPQIIQGYDSVLSINEILMARDIEHNGSRALPADIAGEIVLEDIAFGYGDDAEPVLDGVNVRVSAGTSVAFIGESGSGKSTLLNLLLGTYSPQRGRVLVDGLNLDELDKASYRRHIAVVPQSTVLFEGTLWENLTYGTNYLSTAEVLDALRKVGLAELAEASPDGLDMPIAEGGANLSGGQRQRIAIARALLRQPRIILFDEATSALDVESEQQVQEAIDAIMGECTVVMVAHRLSTLRKVDAIYRIEGGNAIPCDPAEVLAR
ncbi:MAG: ABC transporter ATP-binding protein [Coriobacteriaceae bacterium]|nr:ABC transporter ATP-binding protein [Coriobacteriaceae bacterium]